jgi:CelD/BcsL family acetyltransferase involved in cellulose biosynthesis
MRRRGPFRTLTELGRQPGNYWDALALPDRRDSVAGLIVTEIERRSDEWDALVLGALPQGSAIAGALDRAGARVHRRAPIPYPGIALPASFEEYLARLPSKRRKDLRRHLRRLDEGELTCHHVTQPEALHVAIERWQDLRIRWWERRGRRIDPEHAGTRFHAFLLDLMLVAVPQGLGMVWEFHHRGEVVGIEISLVDSASFYAWLDGYDPDAANLGLGKTAIALGIRSSIEAGRRYFDFMVGDEDYKYWYGAEDRSCEWLMATTGHWRSRLARGSNALLERFSDR